MANQIVNAAPMVIDYGTQDLSTRLLPREPEFIPQHLPKFFIYAQKGPTEPQLVVGSERDRIYGTETFNLRGKFANHATVFANLVNAEGNSCMLQRVVPDDSGEEAQMTISLSVTSANIDLYERAANGSLLLDSSGTPIIKTVSGAPQSTSGYKIKFIVSNDYSDGTVTTSGSTTTYPIFSFKTSSIGEYGNNSGVRIWAPIQTPTKAMPTKMMKAYKAYPYFISVVNRTDNTAPLKVVETLFGEQQIMCSFKAGVLDPITDKQININDIFINSYQNLNDLRYPKVFGEFKDFIAFEENIDNIVGLFYAKEIAHSNTAYSDFKSGVDADANEKHLFNFVSCVSSFGAPYHSVIFIDDADSVRLTEYSTVFARGGQDGTINDEKFAVLVKNEMEAYLNPDNFVQELAVNVESIIYDSGFPLATKYSLCSFIANRKDTFVVLATHTVGENVLEASEEHSIAIALRTRLQMYPESDYFGTPVMRGMIVGRSGKLRNSQYTKFLPLTAEVAIKSAKYMGAGNGSWKNGSHFDGAPGSIVNYMTDINITWVSTSSRNRNWDVGLNWVQSYDRRSYFFPALKTVYDNDTSVLNSYFTALAICQINKVSHAAWREFTGVSHLTNAQLADRVNQFVIARTQKRFDERFVIVPDTLYTDMDLLRGFSWTLPVKIYAPNMKTVMTTYVQAYRIEDLQTA